MGFQSTWEINTHQETTISRTDNTQQGEVWSSSTPWTWDLRSLLVRLREYYFLLELRGLLIFSLYTHSSYLILKNILHVLTSRDENSNVLNFNMCSSREENLSISNRYLSKSEKRYYHFLTIGLDCWLAV